MSKIFQEYFKLDKCPQGIVWKKAPSPKHNHLVRKPAGRKSKGYYLTYLKGVPTLNHRIVWQIANNEAIPEGYVIHHIDGNTLNNSPDNLMLCTQKDNVGFGKGSFGASEVSGISYHKGVRRWLARTTIDGERKYLGSFLTEEEAIKKLQNFGG